MEATPFAAARWASRTLSPDNEGMETRSRKESRRAASTCRTLSPDNEGMETGERRPFGRSPSRAGHSAPTMRGWKLEPKGRIAFSATSPDTQPRQ